MEISKSRAVVTGAASGLGNAVAKRIVADGGRVAMLDLNRDAGEAAAAELGDNATFIVADVSSEDAVNQAVDQVGS